MSSIDDDNKTSDPSATGDAGLVTATTNNVGEEDGHPGATLQSGEILGDYRVHQKIGWGGCSTVYSAIHQPGGEMVAVKVMHPGLAQSIKQVQRFVQEAQALQSLEHPTLVKVHRVGCTADGRPFIVMELLDGVNLASLIQTRGRFSPAEALEVLRPICEALALAHARGIVHRDIKASNVIIADIAATPGEPGGRRQVKLLDFGIAKLVNPDSRAMQTTIGHILGTPHCMAPEQIRGQKVDGRTDIYAIGALLYRLLTGKHPFEGYDTFALTRMHIHAPPPLPSQSAPVSPQLDAVVRRAMEKDPGNRFEDVTAFKDALAEAVGAPPSETRSSALAVAIYVEGRVEVGCESDDDLLDDLMQVLDVAEQVFTHHDFLIPLQTGNAILGASLVRKHEPEDVVRLRAMDVAIELERRLSARPDADDRIDVNVCLHVDHASLRTVAGSPEIVGGPIVDIGGWAPQQTMDGVCATAETLGFSNDGRAGSTRSYVRIGARRTAAMVDVG